MTGRANWKRALRSFYSVDNHTESGLSDLSRSVFINADPA